jgi:hypothetical protein
MKYLLRTKEKIRITNPTDIAVLKTKAFLSSVAVLISLAFSVIAKKPMFDPSLSTPFIVVNLN